MRSHSLDRTNVVQSALGKWVLNNQLRQVGVLSVKESIDEHAAFLDLFRNGASLRPTPIRPFSHACAGESNVLIRSSCLLRTVWADNADVVSRAYSGTGALKTDYTRCVSVSFLAQPASARTIFADEAIDWHSHARRTGKRSKEGALQDGINSAIRYVKNNFLDGPRQDAYDLVTGTWVPTKGGDEIGWLGDKRDVMIRAVSRSALALPAVFPRYSSHFLC